MWHVCSHNVGGEEGWPLLYNFKGRVGKTVIKTLYGDGKGMLKIGIFIICGQPLTVT